MSPQDAAYNVDWVFLNNSNVHVANNRDWFTTYTPFSSRLGSFLPNDSGGSKVCGVGDVELEVRRSPPQVSSRSRQPSNTLVLKDVLFVPEYQVNVLGGPILETYGVSLESANGESKLTDTQTGAVVGLLDRVKLWKLWLKGQPKGMTSLDADKQYVLSATWSEAEMERWQAHKQRRDEYYNVDWVYSNNSNVHVATHRDWFHTFTPFASSFGHLSGAGQGTAVVGIGHVALDIRTSETDRGASNRIVLKDVLYAPSYTCNMLGQPVCDTYEMKMISPHWKLIDKKTGDTAGLLEQKKLPKLWLKGQQSGTSSLDPDGSYWINARWSEGEVARWEAQKRSQATTGAARPPRNTSAPASDSQSQPDWALTSAEKKFLQDHYGGEFQFLMQHGLKMYKEEDREEGRAILRAIMTED